MIKNDVPSWISNGNLRFESPEVLQDLHNRIHIILVIIDEKEKVELP